MIDWSRVGEFRDEIGAEDFPEVIEIFLEEVEEEIEKLKSPGGQNDLEASLHLIKGCALNFGFDAFAKLCQQGESGAAAGTPEAIDLPAIFDSYAQSKAEFMAKLETLDAA